MLFFQVLLLAGYAYAHWIARQENPRFAAAVHVFLLALACMVLPITRAESMRPTESTAPITNILWLLSLTVGLPYLMLSTTGPLIQHWFGRLHPTRSPFRLYALSNFSSLLALLSYPVLVEPHLSVRHQGLIWSACFGLFAVLIVGVSFLQAKARPRLEDSPSIGQSTFLPLWRRALCWFLLPALASVMLLAVTNQLCQNVAVVPMLWIAPLSVYLLSFILSFNRETLYIRRLFASVAILVIVFLCKGLLATDIGSSTWYFEPESVREISNHQLLQISLYLGGLFAVCVLCHGEAVKAKPSTNRLTAFYLWMSAGGAFGGVLVSLICPHVFSNFAELNIALVVSFVLAWVLLYQDIHEKWLKSHVLRYSFFLAGVLGITAVVGAQLVSLSPKPETLAETRNFYGILSIAEEISPDGVKSRLMYSGAAMHGSITLHGMQLGSNLRDEPTLYYTRQSGVGLTLDNFPRDEERGLHVGIIGLGVGTVATYGHEGDKYRFYEINPEVDRLAREHFSFLDNSKANVEVVFGDGRAVLESEQPQEFDVIIVDAFSGDTIPTHLLTREAISLYLDKHLKPKGVLALHLSNRHMNLLPVAAKQAKHAGVQHAMCRSAPEERVWTYSSNWVLLTRSESFFSIPAIAEACKRIPPAAYEDTLWTDQRNTIFRLLLRGPKYLQAEIKNALPYSGG